MEYFLISGADVRDWGKFAADIATIAAVLGGGLFAFWRFVLPGAFTPVIQVDVRGCAVRRVLIDKYAYTVDLVFTNYSGTVLRRESVRAFVGPVPAELQVTSVDPASLQEVRTLARTSLIAPKAPTPLLVHSHPSNELYEAILFSLEVRYSGRWLGTLGWRKTEKLAETMVIPVEIDGLARYAIDG